MARFDLAALLLLATSAASLLLIGLLLRGEPGSGLSARLAAVSLRERRVIFAALALGVAAHLAAVDARLDLLSFEDVPLGAMDCMANAESVLLLERRLTQLDTPAVRVGAALANHMAGNTERARELYERLGGNPRTRTNRNALMGGARIPPEPMLVDDFLRAHTTRRPLDWVPPRLLEIFWDRAPSAVALSALMSLCRVATLGLLLFFAIGTNVVAALDGARSVAQRPHWALPGSALLALRRPATAYLTLLLLSFAAIVSTTQLALHPSVPSMGALSIDYQAGLRSFPLPYPEGVTPATDAEIERAIRVFYWDFLRARPEVLALWIAALLAGVAGVTLHVRGLRQWKATLGAPTKAAFAAETTDAARLSRPA
jgi:hypothetical protein